MRVFLKKKKGLIKVIWTWRNNVDCAMRITVCRSMSSSKLLSLIFVKQWRTCFKNIYWIIKYKHASFRWNYSFIRFLLCYPDFRLLNRRHENVNIVEWQDWIQHLYISSTLSTVKESWDGEIEDVLLSPTQGLIMLTFLNLHDN